VAVFLDGKTFADMTMVIAVGITITGEKHILGFVETGTENEAALTPFLQGLGDRGLDHSQGLLVIIDGGKGLRAAVRHAFGSAALVQRCQWHKRENVVSHYPKATKLRGGPSSSARMSGRRMGKRGRPCIACSETWRTATNRRPGVWTKGWRKP